MGGGAGFGLDGLIDMAVSGETCFAVCVEVGTVVGAENGNPGGTEFCIAVDLTLD